MCASWQTNGLRKAVCWWARVCVCVCVYCAGVFSHPQIITLSFCSFCLSSHSNNSVNTQLCKCSTTRSPVLSTGALLSSKNWRTNKHINNAFSREKTRERERKRQASGPHARLQSKAIRAGRWLNDHGKKKKRKNHVQLQTTATCTSVPSTPRFWPHQLQKESEREGRRGGGEGQNVGQSYFWKKSLSLC